MNKVLLTCILMSCVSAAGCAVDAEPEEDLEGFSDGGKEDTGRGLMENTPDAFGVLRVANELSLTDLETPPRLRARCLRDAASGS